mgnify:CR=1 FL=1
MNIKAEIKQSNINFRKRELLLLLIINYIPLIHLIMCLIPFYTVNFSFSVKFIIALSFLYLLPPILAILVISTFGLPKGKLKVPSKNFFVWWFLFQLQVIFVRFPFLEELLRIIPGCYSLWLRLWGAKIGKLTFWSPGVAILDRSYLRIGDNVMFGASVRLNPHVLDRNKKKHLELLVDYIFIEDDVLVGGYSLVTTGCQIKKGEIFKATLMLPPYSLYQDQKRIKGESRGVI